MPDRPARGEIWTAALDLTRGREQAGARPVLVVSTNALNRGPSGLLFVLPLTRTGRFNPLHVPIEPPEGGLQARSFILCDALRSISAVRLGPRPWGRVSARTMAEVEDRLRILLDL